MASDGLPSVHVWNDSDSSAPLSESTITNLRAQYPDHPLSALYQHNLSPNELAFFAVETPAKSSVTLRPQYPAEFRTGVYGVIVLH
jgi:hypothetical protein